MDSAKEIANGILMNADFAPFLAILKAARNGAVYGSKVRFPHALVMVFLFRSGSFREKVWLVYKATRQHARNLASFAVVYKSSMLALRYLDPTPGGKEGPFDTFFAGLVGGYAVFGRGKQGSVNQQIVIYVFARVMLALAKISMEPRPQAATLDIPAHILSEETRTKIKANAWPVFASLSWAFVMYIFRWYPDTIQPSLRSSMKYIYVQSDHWDSFRNFLWHNT